ncbi:MAG: ribose 5-phosphate isomerase B [Thermogutta sp.]|nr:ribose 5-phosphate isomerase B [Thermogutta sp.]HOP77026.1 ribose 5-phosphate isomerase B [Thermogutta sp.]HPU07812.1 ribose 5-phosphate isomerase B [Thermogutta sp.]HPZ83264.1 ribose 5-phosphate isomerase B [Thermogutta sp.]HQF15267.1 ribose 5-phosphate isomerase B [Thermogutta sp.]
MRIVVGSDHRGSTLRHKVIAYLSRLGQEVIDVGVDSQNGVDYPDVAAEVARRISGSEGERGLLICGTGLGMAIVANKFPGVRAAPCHDELMVEIARRHNDLNVLCLAADLVGELLAIRLIDVWLQTEFEGGRHARRLQKIAQIESNGHYRK